MEVRGYIRNAALKENIPVIRPRQRRRCVRCIHVSIQYTKQRLERIFASCIALGFTNTY